MPHATPRHPAPEGPHEPAPAGLREPDSDWNALDLTAALRLIRHARRPDPTRSGLDRAGQLQAILDALCELSMQDGLTGLLNASAFRMMLDRELDRSARAGRPCALLLLDLDHFKSVNDAHGHAAGDAVLQALAAAMRDSLRSSMDTAARVGGEEFAIILPECTPLEAVRAAARLHAALLPLRVPWRDGTLSVTASAGLAWGLPGSLPSSQELFEQADRELYRAKASGRRQLCRPPLPQDDVSAGEHRALTFVYDSEVSHGS